MWISAEIVVGELIVREQDLRSLQRQPMHGMRARTGECTVCEENYHVQLTTEAVNAKPSSTPFGSLFARDAIGQSVFQLIGDALHRVGFVDVMCGNQL